MQDQTQKSIFFKIGMVVIALGLCAVCIVVAGAGGWFLLAQRERAVEPDGQDGGEVAQDAPVNRVLFNDDFSDPASGWERFADSNYSVDYTSDGSYLIDVFVFEWDVWSTANQDFLDVSIEVDAVNLGSPKNHFGITCREQSQDSLYLLEITSEGNFLMSKYVDAEYSELASGLAPAGAINPGSASNHLRADCVGADLSLYANGKWLGSVKDTSFTHGYAGVVASTFSASTMKVQYDNFVVYAP